jgi:hypothetical protein
MDSRLRGNDVKENCRFEENRRSGFSRDALASMARTRVAAKAAPNTDVIPAQAGIQSDVDVAARSGRTLVEQRQNGFPLARE